MPSIRVWERKVPVQSILRDGDVCAQAVEIEKLC